MPDKYANPICHEDYIDWVIHAKIHMNLHVQLSMPYNMYRSKITNTNKIAGLQQNEFN